MFLGYHTIYFADDVLHDNFVLLWVYNPSRIITMRRKDKDMQSHSLFKKSKHHDLTADDELS
jgi:hypothetical protein